MKNPFKKNESSAGLIAGLAIGVIATAGLVYVYLQKRAAMKAAAKELKAHAKDYLKVKAGKFKKHKSDIEQLDHLIHAQ